MRTAGLSLEQAPPIHVPFRFFLTAPLFLFAAALLLGWQGDAVLASRWSPAALAATHLIAIGFLGQIMCGASLQLLPVIAGAPVPAVKPVGSAVNLLLALGAGLLAWGFLGGGPAVLTAGAVCSALGFLVFLVFAGAALSEAQGVPQTAWAMRLSFAALLVTLGLGLVLTAALLGWVAIDGLAGLADFHLAWGLLGWVGLLLVAVAYQVVPMFHVTPPYPAWLTRWLSPVVAVALTLGSLLAFTGAGAAGFLALGVAAIAFSLFAAVTIWLQLRRARRRIDATVLHWWLAMASVIAVAVTWAFAGDPVLTGILLLIGVGTGLPTGMLFKIVPFLAWFHLQHRQLDAGRFDVRVPHMLIFLPDGQARWQFAGHALALTGLVAAWGNPELIPLASGALALSALSLGVLLAGSVLRFRRTAAALQATRCG
jgi:hypothetical protein